MSGARLRRFWPLGVALLAPLPFLASLSDEFLNYDDTYLVAENQELLRPPLRRLVAPWRPDVPLVGGEYLPLRDLSYALDLRLLPPAGSEALPAGAARVMRLSNLLHYALVAGLAALLLLRLERADPRAPWTLPALAALLFAWHPVHAESVAWISGRKDLLSGALVLGSLLLHLRARDGASWAWLGSGLLAGLACLAKSTATATPLLVLACELREARHLGWRRLAARLLPTAIPCAAAALLAIYVGQLGGVARPPRPLPLVLLADLPILRRYLVTAFFPVVLRLDHGDLVQALDLRAQPGLANPGLWTQALLALGALLPLLLLAARPRRQPRPRWAAVWFLGGLLPVLNLVPFSQWLADRFLFLPALAAALLIAAGVHRLGRSRPRAAVALGLGLILAWGARAGLRAAEFRTSEALWDAELRRDPDDPVALRHRGDAELRRALANQDPAARRALAERACQLLERALPAFAALQVPSEHHLEALLALGDAQRLSGRGAEARATLELARREFPRHPGPLHKLGVLALQDVDPARAYAAYRALLDLLGAGPAVAPADAERFAGLARNNLVVAGNAALRREAPGDLALAARAYALAGHGGAAREVLLRLHRSDPGAAAALAGELGLLPPGAPPAPR